MCGIFAIVSEDECDVSDSLMNGLKRLEYRGYDSAGIAVLKQGGFIVNKSKGKVSELSFEHVKGRLGLGHTRWATHGAPSKINAHPHTGCNNKVSVVHNGIIENYQSLKKELISKGHVFCSETDSEVIPHLVEEGLSQGLSFRKACFNCLNKLKGSFALVIGYSDCDYLITARKESPISIGIKHDSCFIASDAPALIPLTREVYYLDDYEVGVVKPGRVEFYDFNGDVKSKDSCVINWSVECAGKVLNGERFEHFMLKELHEVPDCLRKQLMINEYELIEFAREVVDCDEVIFTGAGTAFHACLTGKYLFKNLAGVKCRAVLCSEFEQECNNLSNNACVISISQSGETADTLNAVNYAKKEFNAKILSLVNVMGSSLTRCSDKWLRTTAGIEIAVASQKAYCCQVMLLNLISLKLAEIKKTLNKSELKECKGFLKELPNKCRRVLNDEFLIKEIAERVKNSPSVYFLARGVSKPVSMEGSLKLKEVSYNHAEFYPAGESKHGPIALINEGFPVIFTAPMDETYNNLIGNVMELKSRGALIISVVDECDEMISELSDYVVKIPVKSEGFNNLLSNILFTLPLQLLAYYSAVSKGLNPDKPRNLAKSVTVK